MNFNSKWVLNINIYIYIISEYCMFTFLFLFGIFFKVSKVRSSQVNLYIIFRKRRLYIQLHTTTGKALWGLEFQDLHWISIKSLTSDH